MTRGARLARLAVVSAALAGCGGPGGGDDAVGVSPRVGVVRAAAQGAAPAAPVAADGAGRSSLVDAATLSSLGYVGVGVPVWATADSRQTLFGTDFRDFVVLDEVRDGSGEWIGMTHARRADIDVLRFASARKDVFVMAGFAANGDFVLQRWTLEPAGAVASPQAALVGKRFAVAEIYRGPLAQGVRGLEFDAEERFLVALVESGDTVTLYRFDNAVGAVPTVISDSQRLPALAGMRDLQKFDHRQLGRVWRLDDFPACSRWILLVDVANDGRFDAEPVVVEQAEWDTNPLYDYTQWNPLLGPR